MDESEVTKSGENHEARSDETRRTRWRRLAAEDAIRNGTRRVAPMGYGVDLVAATSPKIVLGLTVGASFRKVVYRRQ